MTVPFCGIDSPLQLPEDPPIRKNRRRRPEALTASTGLEVPCKDPYGSDLTIERSNSAESARKTCSKCGQDKPESDYQKNGKGGLKAHCRACDAKRWAEYHARNGDAIRARGRGYSRRNRTLKTAYEAAWRDRNYHRARAADILLIARRDGTPIDPYLETPEGRAAVAALAEAASHCEYCGAVLADGYEFDHRIARSRGGEHSLQNLAVVCPTCNQSKGPRPLTEWWAAMFEAKLKAAAAE